MCGEADLGDAGAAEHIEHIHDQLVLVGAIATHDHWQLRVGGLELAEFAFEVGKRDWHRVELDAAAGIDGDRLGLGRFHFLGGLRACAREVHLHPLHAGGRHDDEDEQEDQIEVYHRGDIDVVEAFVVGGGHGGGWVGGRSGNGFSCLSFGFVGRAVELGHFRDELVDEDLHVGHDGFDAAVEVAVNE